jgi:hypothetical protein
MEKAEALEFMGLKEPLSEEAVSEKYMERFNYFHMLYSNAPNRVVEQIQKQNLEKLNYVKNLLLGEIAVKKKSVDKKNVNPPLKPKADAPKAAGKSIMGWLIVHTENKKAETFEVLEGINYIGRKKKDDKANYILIENDPFVSRTHAFIKCKETNGKPQYMLYDGDGNKPSVNGVFLNGNDLRINISCSLKENDTVQIGSTKLVFKVKKDDRAISAEIEEVIRTDYIRTIDIYQ